MRHLTLDSAQPLAMEGRSRSGSIAWIARATVSLLLLGSLVWLMLASVTGGA